MKAFGFSLSLPPHRIFGLSQSAQGLFPSPLQFGCNQSIVGINTPILTFRQCRVVTETFELLRLRSPHLLVTGILLLQRLIIEVEFGARERFKKSPDHLFVNRVGGNMLANRNAVSQAQITTAIMLPLFVLHSHFVPGLAAIDQPLEQGCALTWNSTRSVASIFSTIVVQHALNFLIGFPGHVSRIFVVDTLLPV